MDFLISKLHQQRILQKKILGTWIKCLSVTEIDKGLIFRIHKKLLVINENMTETPMGKWVKDMNTKEKCSESLKIRKIQI